MRFDDSIRERWTTTGEDTATCEIPEGWGQGRSVFGGLTGALAVSLAARTVPSDRQIRSANIHFLKQTSAGPVEGRVTTLRAGRSVSFIQVDLYQHDERILQSTQVWAVGRAGCTEIKAPPAAEQPPVETTKPLPNHPLLPEFLKHIDLRWTEGTPPFMGGDKAELRGYCKLASPGAGPEAVLALVDAWPCPSLSTLRKFAPASSVSWTVQFTGNSVVEGGWHPFESRTVQAAEGYHHMQGCLYDPSGRLIATSTQVAAVFDKG